MKALAHFITIAVAAAVLVGVPFAAFANAQAIAASASGVDLVSSATTIQEAPSGHYTIMINRAKHVDSKVLGDWVTFFSGEDAPLIMEDISCVVIAEDPAGIEMAESLQSRLPANQMTVRVEGATMALSKADAGLFDVIVMSDEVAQAYGADSIVSSQDVEVINR